MIGDDVLASPTETEMLREQLMRAQRQCSVGILASSVAHEFNNILTTIINYAKLGLRPNETETGRRQALEKILKAGQRAALIVNSMLGFARNNTANRELTDVAELVEEVLVLTEKDLRKHQVQVELNVAAHPKVPVVRGQIEQILLNLTINARQAMPDGGKLTFDIRENKRTRMAEVSISDTGVGIPPEKLRCIFEPFYTTKKPDANGHGGNGLGLSVCRQIIEQHQGRIRVESRVGKGTRFTVKLPMDFAKDAV